MQYVHTLKSYQSVLERMPRLIMMGKETIYGPSERRFPHKHEYLEILLIIEGTGVHTINGEAFFVSAGNVLVHNAEQIHARVEAQGLRLYSCFVEDVHFPALPKNCLVPKGMSPVIPTARKGEEALPDFLRLNQRLYELVSRNKDEVAEYLLCYYLLELYSAAQRQPIETRKKDANADLLAASVKEYLDSHYDDDALSLAMVARDLHVSLYYLSHMFKSCYHISPMQYVKHRRVGEAQTLLADSDRTITEIALQVGFSSANQFHHVFAQMVGTSPAQYRKHWHT